MTRSAPARPRPRGRLTRERVLRRALRMADEGGIEAVSMRRLAAALGVEAMSLYNHVDGKEAVLDGLVALVLAEFPSPAPADDWEAAVREVALGGHAALLRHPWAAPLAMAPIRPGAALIGRLRYIESLLASFRQAGFSAELAYHAYHAVDSYTFGFTIWQLGHRVAGAEGLQEAFSQMSMDAFPYLAEHAQLHEVPAPGGKLEFDFGLDLVLEGLRRLRQEQGSLSGTARRLSRRAKASNSRPST